MSWLKWVELGLNLCGQVPIRWPASRDEVWQANVPHTFLATEKSDQHWMVVNGQKVNFPGGGTHFSNGADKYIAHLGKVCASTCSAITRVFTGFLKLVNMFWCTLRMKKYALDFESIMLSSFIFVLHQSGGSGQFMGFVKLYCLSHFGHPPVKQRKYSHLTL